MVLSAAQAQTNYYITNGAEYSVVGSLPGDQVHPDVAIGTNGGYVVWQDNATDGSGWGISARRIDSSLSAVTTLSQYPVNQITTNNQENPRVGMLKNGGAVFVWQGGAPSYQHIYAAFQGTDGIFLNSTDILVSSSSTCYQANPAVAVLNNSNVVVVYSSMNQVAPNSLQDVYGQLLSPTGGKIGSEFLINQFTNYNQRSASVAPLAGGGFIVTWISEQQRTLSPVISPVGAPSALQPAAAFVSPSIDVEGRIFDANGSSSTSEFLVNTDNNVCAQPAVAADSDGGFLIVWAARDSLSSSNSWDVHSRGFAATGLGGAVSLVNTYRYGDQLFPRIAALNLDYLVTWTSYLQDGSREGVYAQELHADTSHVDLELRVNTTTIGAQIHPVVTSDGVSQFLVVWSTFTDGVTLNDLAAQRYVNVSAMAALPALGAPYVSVPFTLTNNVYQGKLVVTWSRPADLSVSNFEVYVDGNGTPFAILTSNQWSLITAPNASHSFAVDYTVADGRRSPLSPATSGTTWSGANWFGLPAEWMTQYFGSDISKWPMPNVDSDGDGVSNLQEFLAGTNPTDATSVLRQELVEESGKLYLHWTTQPGLIYQVQFTGDFVTWTNVGSGHLATGTSDETFVNTPGYYRIVLQR